MATPTPPKLRILMLHGFTNTGAVFRAKTRALEKVIQKAFPSSTLHYADGPHRLRPSDIPGYPGSAPDPRASEPDDAEIESYAWWRRKDPSAGSDEPVVYAGIEQGLARIAESVRAHGPFDGVIGFSQGACATSVVASLLEGAKRRDAMAGAREKDGRKMEYPADSFWKEDGKPLQDPLKFAVIYSGFAAHPDVYGALYEPRIRTPSLHVIGSLDTIVSEERSRQLADSFDDPSFFVHPGGHFCPSTKEGLEAVVSFIKRTILGESVGQPQKKGLDDVKAEDMDMPF